MKGTDQSTNRCLCTHRNNMHPNDKATEIAVRLENQFTSHDLSEDNLERQVGTRVQALLASVEDTLLVN
jgi:hypothetical protein